MERESKANIEELHKILLSEECIQNARERLYLAMEIGEQLLISGAEISRVEDTIRRICIAYGAERIDVFTITSSIVATMYHEDYGPITQTRRISKLTTDFHKLNMLNQLSRKICSENLTSDAIKVELEKINNEKNYSFKVQLLIYAVISASFAIFFGGDINDAIASAFVGIIMKCLITITVRFNLNKFLESLLCSFIGGLLSILLVWRGIGHSVEMISIGNIMLLIPGMALTNSIRDMFSGDTIAGTIRFVEAILLAMTIAFGFAAATSFGGILF